MELSAASRQSETLAPSGSSPIRRRRRTKADMEAIREAIIVALAADHPMTVRQVFYRLTSEGAIAKTEAEYKGTICRLLADMRRAGEIPYDWLADSTRWMRKPRTFDSVEDALQATASTYRRALWSDAEVAVEIWLEKEALAGVLVEVTDEWDVPLMVTRGYPSMSFLYSAAQTVEAREEYGQRTQIYYFGDRDPSGVDIDRAVCQGIGEALGAGACFPEHFTPNEIVNTYIGGRALGVDRSSRERQECEREFGACADFTRVAVTEAQIEAWDLPTRPTKRTDTRAKNFDGESVELDALPPSQLRALAGEVIERHVDEQRLDVLRTYEHEEREGLMKIAEALR